MWELHTQMIFVVFFLQVAVAAQQWTSLTLPSYLLVSHSLTEAVLAVRYYSHLNQVLLTLQRLLVAH